MLRNKSRFDDKRIEYILRPFLFESFSKIRLSKRILRNTFPYLPLTHGTSTMYK